MELEKNLLSPIDIPNEHNIPYSCENRLQRKVEKKKIIYENQRQFLLFLYAKLCSTF